MTSITSRGHRLRHAAGAACTSFCLSACVGGGDEALPELRAGTPLSLVSDGGAARVEVQPIGHDSLRQGENRLTVRVTSSNTDATATLVDVTAFMPAHGHGLDAVVEPTSDETYEATGLDFFMPGRWEITLHLVVDEIPDEATFAAEVH